MKAIRCITCRESHCVSIAWPLSVLGRPRHVWLSLKSVLRTHPSDGVPDGHKMAQETLTAATRNSKPSHGPPDQIQPGAQVEEALSESENSQAGPEKQKGGLLQLRQS